MPTVDVSKSANHKRFASLFAAEWREVLFDASKQNLAQNESAGVIGVKAGERVLAVEAEVKEADANAGNAEVGDDADSDGYLEAFNANATGYHKMAVKLSEGTPNAVNGYTSGGKYYAADDTIDIKALGANGLTTAKILVRALVVPKTRAAAA